MATPLLQLNKNKNDSIKRNTSMFDVTPSEELLFQLTSMGFIQELAEQALIHTKNGSVQAAMDWILDHPEGIDPLSQLHKEPKYESNPSSSISTSPSPPISKVNIPEKENPVVEAKISSRYAAREEELKIHREKERQRELEQRKKERILAQKEKERVLKEMQEDKLRRAQKAQTATNVNTNIQTATTVPIPSQTGSKVQYTTCTLQIRLPDGSVQKLDFQATDTLKKVHQHITKNFTKDSSFLLIVPFPRKEFKDNMLGMTLLEAELAPRGTLTVQMIADKGVIKKYEEPIDDEDVDTDSMSYEQLLDLEDKVGYVNKGTPKEAKDIIPTYIFDSSSHNPEKSLCLICQCDFENGETLKRLPCNHDFHRDCIDQWLNSHNECPVCRT